jgi:hypothetical protein
MILMIIKLEMLSHGSSFPAHIWTTQMLKLGSLKIEILNSLFGQSKEEIYLDFLLIQKNKKFYFLHSQDF